MAEFSHVPVLLTECIEGLAVKPNGTYVDCTRGGGGHSEKIAERLKNGKLIAFDKDEEAMSYARRRLEAYADRTI